MKRERVYVEGRRNQIMEMLQKNPRVMVDELARRFDVSVITIRRDLQYLEDSGLLTRFYGGAKAAQTPEAADETVLYRDLIARYAATLAEDGDTIFINTSRTALETVRYIAKNNVTVVTNNGRAINHERSEGVSVILSGGELRYPKEAMVGDFAVKNLQSIYAKKAFIGCTGISAQIGMTTEIANEVNVNRLMIEHANEVYILADHTKIGKNSSFISCEIGMVKHLITDEKAPQEELKLIKAKGIDVYQVKKDDF